MNADIYTIITFLVYFAIMLGIGIYFFVKSKSTSDYFLGGRQLGSWVTAISAQASDMSGWLLMGLPASVFLYGLTESWIAIGLFIGTYLNWRIVASRLRRFTAASGDAITIPEYLQNRFGSRSVVIRIVCAVIIFVFFLVYTASAFNGGAKLFSYVFGFDYVVALTVGALIIIAYTFLGGFLAVCWTDLIQGLMMFAALIVVPIVCIMNTPDFSFAMLSEFPERVNFINFFKNEDGAIAITSILSGLAWGLGYFGMPHILVRFMAIKNSELIKKSRIIATVWVFISLIAACAVGIFGYAYATGNEGVMATLTADPEKILMVLSRSLMPSIIAGVLLSAILAAIMSTADSQLLVTASSVTNDIYGVIKKKKPDEKKAMWVSRITVMAIAVIAYILALNPENTVMGLVSYAWAGLGAAFGPVIILSLFWRRMTAKGAVAGMLAGGLTVVLWESFLSFTNLYSLLPAFAIAMLSIIVVSLIDKAPSDEVVSVFERAQKVDL